ncbi:uncharacterized protein LOC125061696 isoform X1 [Pieris napi]|uniref:uncharacterized protein LOC125061696 isoform X1 n=2 Tax=Pieris napi TaxID=78633 RepID=UPI001FB8AE2E|nr:uncharacterized protein LOC125061696 isoform X1 [Pieris napi]
MSSLRTSYTQFSIMVEFMEKNGDLSKCQNSPSGRLWTMKKWQELTDMLNSQGTREARSEEKWRKVWSDFKNNTKRKLAKITHSLQGRGGRPTTSKCLTELEQRALAITGILTTIGPATESFGSGECTIEVEEKNINPTFENLILVPTTTALVTDGADWNNSESSKDKDEESILPMSTMSPLRIKTSPKSSPPDSPQPYLQQKRKMDDRDDDEDEYLARRASSPKEETRERDRMYVELEKEKLYAELEKERIRQRDVELRQRDTALQLQAQWLELARSGLNILDKYLNDKK